MKNKALVTFLIVILSQLFLANTVKADFYPGDSGWCSVFPELANGSANVYASDYQTGDTVRASAPSLYQGDTQTLNANPGDTIHFELDAAGGPPDFDAHGEIIVEEGRNRPLYQLDSPGTSGSYDITIPLNFNTLTYPDNVFSASATGGACGIGTTAAVFINVSLNNPDFTLSCTPATQTITAGNTASYSLTTTAQNGFASAVTFSGSTSPSSGTPPTISFSNNGQAPSATTTAIINTTTSTTATTYTLTFTGTGGGQSHSCQTQVIVNPVPRGISFTVTPNPSSILKGSNATFTVTANCTGTFSTPLHDLAASSPYPGLTYTLSSTTVNCGQSVTLTIGNTAQVPDNQLSTPQDINPRLITVTGIGD